MAETRHNLYPNLVVKNNEHPNRWLAFPILGILFRAIILIPVFIVGWVYGLVYIFYWFILPFYIVFTGKYWDSAYKFIVSYLKFYSKVYLYMTGLTDKYPGFTLDDGGLFELHVEKPNKPNRWLAIPLVGLIIRIVLLIPYIIYMSVLQYGAGVAVIASWFAVLFKGKYPESLYEFNRDTLRVSLAATVYIDYLSDKYPDFWISMKHKTIKILLIVAGAILFLSDVSDQTKEKQADENLRYQYENNQNFDYQNTP